MGVYFRLSIPPGMGRCVPGGGDPVKVLTLSGFRFFRQWLDGFPFRVPLSEGPAFAVVASDPLLWLWLLGVAGPSPLLPAFPPLVLRHCCRLPVVGGAPFATAASDPAGAAAVGASGALPGVVDGVSGRWWAAVRVRCFGAADGVFIRPSDGPSGCSRVMVRACVSVAADGFYSRA